MRNIWGETLIIEVVGDRMNFTRTVLYEHWARATCADDFTGATIPCNNTRTQSWYWVRGDALLEENGITDLVFCDRAHPQHPNDPVVKTLPRDEYVIFRNSSSGSINFYAVRGHRIEVGARVYNTTNNGRERLITTPRSGGGVSVNAPYSQVNNNTVHTLSIDSDGYITAINYENEYLYDN